MLTDEHIKTVISHNRKILNEWPDRELANLILTYYDFIEHFDGHISGLQQVLEELQQVKNLLIPRKFNTFVELGSDDGGSLWIYVNTFCDKDSIIYSIDIHLKPSLQAIVNKLKELGFNIQVITKQSDDPELVSLIKTIPIDLLHIDADHAYDSIKIEWDIYYPQLTSNGVALLHDTLLHGGPIAFRKFIEHGDYNYLTVGGTTSLSDVKNVTTGITMVIKDE